MYAVVDRGPVLRFAFRLLKKRILHETACSRRCQPSSRAEEPDNPRFGLTLLNQLSNHLQLLHPPMNTLLPLRIQQSINIVLAQRQPLLPTHTQPPYPKPIPTLQSTNHVTTTSQQQYHRETDTEGESKRPGAHTTTTSQNCSGSDTRNSDGVCDDDLSIDGLWGSARPFGGKMLEF